MSLRKIHRKMIDDNLISDIIEEVKTTTGELELLINEVNNDILNYHEDYEYQTPVIKGEQIQLVKSSNTNRLLFKLNSNLNGNIKISTDGGVTSKNLVDIEGNLLTSLDKGFHEVVLSKDFFILRNKSGGVKPEELEDLSELIGYPALPTDDILTQLSKFRDIKTDLAKNMRDKNVEAVSSEPLKDLADKISQIQLSMFASGVVKSATTSANFVYVSGTSSTSRYFIEFKELKFKPKILIAFNYVSSGSLTLYMESSDGNYTDTVKTLTFGSTDLSGFTANFKANSSGGYVNSTGFKIPVATSGRDYSFIAFG